MSEQINPFELEGEELERYLHPDSAAACRRLLDKLN